MIEPTPANRSPVRPMCRRQPAGLVLGMLEVALAGLLRPVGRAGFVTATWPAYPRPAPLDGRRRTPRIECGSVALAWRRSGRCRTPGARPCSARCRARGSSRACRGCRPRSGRRPACSAISSSASAGSPVTVCDSTSRPLTRSVGLRLLDHALDFRVGLELPHLLPRPRAHRRSSLRAAAHTPRPGGACRPSPRRTAPPRRPLASAVSDPSVPTTIDSYTRFLSSPRRNPSRRRGRWRSGP